MYSYIFFINSVYYRFSDNYFWIVYINLDYREDRKAIFLKEMERLKVKEVHRISAHYDPLNGVRGCLISHLEALDFMEKKGWKRGLILEDDCFFEKDCSNCNPWKGKEERKFVHQDVQRTCDQYPLGATLKSPILLVQ